MFLIFAGSSAGKESICSVRVLGSIPGLGRSPGEGKGYPLQYSGLENFMDYIVIGVTKSWTRLSDFCFCFPESWFSSVQSLSHVQLFVTPWTGLPVHHQLLELTQTHVHWVGDAIQSTHPLSSLSPTFNHSQNQSLFQWVSSSHQVAKVLEFQLQHPSFQ